MQRQPVLKPFEIAGVVYLSVDQVAREIGISRITLWRWRRRGTVPPGYRYRGRLTLFTVAEYEAIRDYADRLSPIGPSPSPHHRVGGKHEQG
jgi:predicted DNA-binding transcriptional regulator AlpA